MIPALVLALSIGQAQPSDRPVVYKIPEDTTMRNGEHAVLLPAGYFMDETSFKAIDDGLKACQAKEAEPPASVPVAGFMVALVAGVLVGAAAGASAVLILRAKAAP